MATPKPFELIAGHPALDLVNTLDHRFGPPATRENLDTWDDLLRFVTQSGLLSENKSRKLKRLESTPVERTQVLTDVITLRETVAAIAYAHLDHREIPEEALTTFDTICKQAAIHRRLIAAE